MINTQAFMQELLQQGFDFFSGVPCLYLDDVFKALTQLESFHMACNEGEAVAMACGAHLKGAQPAVFMQNSGLNNAMSPLTSLANFYDIPMLLFVSLRGDPACPDVAQHSFMGKITPALLQTLEIEFDYLSKDHEQACSQLKKAQNAIAKGNSYCFIVQKESFSRHNAAARIPNKPNIKAQPRSQVKQVFADSSLTRADVIQSVIKGIDEQSAIVATTGKTCSELFTLHDQSRNFYMLGSLGLASSIGLGLASMGQSTVVLDGDGGLLMHLGALVTNGYYAPDDFLHLLIDNGCHDSTGGQDSLAKQLDFLGMAQAANYAVVKSVRNSDELEQCLHEWKERPQASFVYVPVKKHSLANIQRPSISAELIKKRFMQFVAV